MNIHWYPGHMTKALRLIRENVKFVDIIVYVLDARIPASCINESFDEVISGKPVLFVLNKADLADSKKTNMWLNFFKESGYAAVAVNGCDNSSAKQLLSSLDGMDKKKVEKFESKGAVIPTRVMVIGIPNSGKSTLINTLSGKKMAVTGNKPGITRGKQWVRLSNGLELLDTPGTLYPDFSDQKKAERLAFAGSVNDDVLDLNELAFGLAAELDSQYGRQFREKYNIGSEISTPQEMLDGICKKRGFVLRGGELDIERASKALIDDFRKARIGRFTLELPNERTP